MIYLLDKLDMMEKDQQLLTAGPAKLRRFPNNINRVYFSLLTYLIKPPIIPELEICFSLSKINESINVTESQDLVSKFKKL